MVETVRAELISTQERFDGVRLAEFQYACKCDGNQLTDSSFNLVTADHDLNLVWTIHRQYINLCNHFLDTYRCAWTMIELQSSDKNFFGKLEILTRPYEPFKTTFDTKSLPFREKVPLCWCSVGGNIIIKIQVYREYQASSLPFNLNDKLLENKSFSDVIFIIGDEEVPANKVILSQESEVFAKMFESDMIEKKTGKVEITDIEPEVFKMLLRSIFSGKLDCDDSEKLIKLIFAADKYEIRNLVDLCAYRISYKITVDNAIDFLVLADQVRSEFLKKDCTNFIIKNKEKIIGTESYENMAKSGRTDLRLLKLFIECLVLNK